MAAHGSGGAGKRRAACTPYYVRHPMSRGNNWNNDLVASSGVLGGLEIGLRHRRLSDKVS